MSWYRRFSKIFKRRRPESSPVNLETGPFDGHHISSELDQPYNEDMMADPQIHPADSSQLAPDTVMANPSPTTPRRSTISTFTAKPTFISRPRFKTGNGQCTHLTMTRMYTNEFRCVLCLRTGSMGWIYRCTQDRELLIEDDMDRGSEVSP
jgi:hypothetical protein